MSGRPSPVGVVRTLPMRTRAAAVRERPPRGPYPGLQSDISCGKYNLLAQETADRLEIFYMIADYLDAHHHRYREQHAPDTPCPAPEEQSDEHRHTIHGCDTAHQER